MPADVSYSVFIMTIHKAASSFVGAEIIPALAKAQGFDFFDISAKAFKAGASTLRGVNIEFLAPNQCGLDQLDRALQRLANLAPKDKQAFMQACAICIHADRTVTEHEAELFRALGVMLGVPVPPITPG